MRFFLVGEELQYRLSDDGRHDDMFGDEVHDLLPFHVELPVLLSSAEYPLTGDGGKDELGHELPVRLQAYDKSAAVLLRGHAHAVVSRRELRLVRRGADERERDAPRRPLLHLETAVRGAVGHAARDDGEEGRGGAVREHLPAREAQFEFIAVSQKLHVFPLCPRRGSTRYPPIFRGSSF